jgi:drug/metabolite transporter (DMT)-like permease
LSETTEGAPPHWRLYSLIVLMTVLWSINYVVAKVALRELPGLMTAGIRTAVAGILMLPLYCRYASKGKLLPWSWRDVPILLGIGAFGVVLNQVIFLVGLSNTSVAHAAIMIGLTPILVLLMACAKGQESIDVVKMIGMAIALAGVCVLQIAPDKITGATLKGDFYVFLAAVAFAIFSVAGKQVTGRFSNITMNTFAYVGGGLMLMPLTLWHSSRIPLTGVSLAAWASIIYMAAFSSVLCYLIYYYALTYIPASRVSAFSYLQPLFATVLAIPYLGERPTISLLAGGCLVLAGVFVTERF